MYLECKKCFVLLMMMTGLIVQGCASSHYSIKQEGSPFRTSSGKFNLPLVVMAPSVKSIRYSPEYDNTCPTESEQGVKYLADNNSLVTTSYEELAAACHTMDSYAFVLITRELGKYPDPATMTLSTLLFVPSLCTLFVFPYWSAMDFTVENTMLYQREKDSDLQVFQTSGSRDYKRTYHLRNDTFMSVIPFFSSFLPSYRMYKEKINYAYNSDKLFAKAVQAQDQPMVQDMIAALFDQTKGTLSSFSYADASFNRLINKIFDQGYDPHKAYILKANYQYGEILEAGAYNSVMGISAERGRPIELEKGHLYMFYQFMDTTRDGGFVTSKFTKELRDLGHIRDLSPVLLSWLHSTRKGKGLFE